jgi:hypothetical protein
MNGRRTAPLGVAAVARPGCGPMVASMRRGFTLVGRSVAEGPNLVVLPGSSVFSFTLFIGVSPFRGLARLSFLRAGGEF